MSVFPNFLKQVESKHQATPNDEIYLHSIRLFCHLCRGNSIGPVKCRKNLHRLAYHYKTIHRDELTSEWETIVNNLEFLIKKQVLK